MQPLVELAESFRIYAVCIPCGRMELLAIENLISRLGETSTVSDVRARLRCRECGERRADVRVIYVGPQQQAAGFRYRQH